MTDELRHVRINICTTINVYFYIDKIIGNHNHIGHFTRPNSSASSRSFRVKFTTQTETIAAETQLLGNDFNLIELNKTKSETKFYF